MLLELNDATASRSLRRRMDRLLANLEAVTDADGEWFAERPSRIHRVREISKAEKAWIKATEFTVRPDRRIYVAVKQVRRGVRLRVTFMAAPLHRPEEFSDAAAKFYWDQAGGSNSQVHEIEEGLRRLTDGREKP